MRKKFYTVKPIQQNIKGFIGMNLHFLAILFTNLFFIDTEGHTFQYIGNIII